MTSLLVASGLAALAVAVSTFVTLRLRGRAPKPDRLALLQDLASTAVLYTQQMGTGLSGEQKLSMALDTFENIAKVANIKLEGDWREVVIPFIEAAVRMMKMNMPEWEDGEEGED